MATPYLSLRNNIFLIRTFKLTRFGLPDACNVFAADAVVVVVVVVDVAVVVDDIYC
jgi:hypothetical protein